MKVTVSLKPNCTEPVYPGKDVDQIAVASGSLVINYSDGTALVCPLDQIGNLIVRNDDDG